MATEWVTLTPSEREQRGKELANKIGELYGIRAEKKNAMNDFKSRIDKAERRIADLSEAVRTGKEMRTRTFFDDAADDFEE